MAVNVDDMTLQEAMDYAVKKIVEQGGRCMADATACAYSDDSGKHCAVGWLLDHDNKSLMGASNVVADLCDVYPDDMPKLILEHQLEFKDLQQFHDSVTSFGRRTYMQGLEQNHSIDTSEPHWQAWVDMGRVK